jgi:hypothetical protein
LYLSALAHLGPAWFLRRLWFKAERASGWLERRCPVRAWDQVEVPDDYAACWRRLAPRLPLAKIDRAHLAPWLEAWALAAGRSPVAEADLLARGRFRIFDHELVEAGMPPRWNASVLDGSTVDASVHWSKLPTDGPTDIKGVWELSRFAWVYPLVRAWVLDGQTRHAETFWRLLEDWMAANPPNRGPQWMCGQEASMRLIAVAFALQAFRADPATTDARLVLTARLATATAERIRGHLAYAVSQSNNHGISESLGLFTAGALWPRLGRSEVWREQGLETLFPQVESLVDRQDGGFSQHSTNYHRLFLQLMTWAEVVLQAEGHQLPPRTRGRVLRATEFLSGLLEPDGTVPRYGADDSANLFPLSGQPAHDFRPALGAAQALFLGDRLAAGPWDEAACLLLGPMPPSAPAWQREEKVLRVVAGVGVLRHPRGTAFFRAPWLRPWRHRPSQADHLHVSLRWDGAWLAEDVGTFTYAGAGPDDFGSAVHHNVVTVDRRGPMRKVGRFLWLPWTSCDLLLEPRGLGASCRDLGGARWARRVLRFPRGFVIVDQVRARDPASSCELRWHSRSRAGLEQLSLACSLPAQEAWITGDARTGEGFFAPRYGRRELAWTRRLTATGPVVTFVTALGCQVELLADGLIVDGETIPLEN